MSETKSDLTTFVELLDGAGVDYHEYKRTSNTGEAQVVILINTGNDEWVFEEGDLVKVGLHGKV